MQSGFARLTARLTPAVKWLVGIEIAVFVVIALAGSTTSATLAQWLVLTPASILDGHVWKLVTTAVFPHSPIQLFIDILILWLFMPFLERQWGTRRFVEFAVITTLVANVVSVLVGLLLGGVHALVPISGLTAFIYASIISTGTEFARQPIALFGVVKMEGRILAIGIAALVVIGMLVVQTWVVSLGHVAAMGAAWLMATGRFTPRLWVLQWRRDRLRRRYKVLDGGAGHRDEKKWLN